MTKHDKDKSSGIETVSNVKSKTLSITIKDKTVLYAAYMSFLKNGGLFIPTKKNFEMGEEINLLINLIDTEYKFNVSCKIVWITPPESQSNKAGGIGVEFSDNKDGEALRIKIEEILGPHLQSNDATHTM